MANSLPMLPGFRFEMVGKRVVRAERGADGLAIRFEGGWDITIWAKCSIGRIGSNESCTDFGLVEGAALATFAGDGKTEKLSFDNSYEIAVDLRTSDAHEAMAVYGPNSVIVVWD